MSRGRRTRHDGPVHVLIAPDRFSGPSNAVQAARLFATGWASSAPGDDVHTLPMSDGSAGLLEAIGAARPGELVPVETSDPLGGATVAAVLHVDGVGGGTAYVEADQAIGRHLVDPGDWERSVRTGTSAPLAPLLEAAASTGAGRIVIGVPGRAATHDGGRGLIEALGGIARARQLLAGRDLVLAVADDLPLLGLHGAGAVLGEEPEIGPGLAQELERQVADWVAQVEDHGPSGGIDLLTGSERVTTAPPSGRAPGSGAAGGVAFALRLLGGRALPGADVVAGEIGLAGAVAGTDLILTGTAVFDAPGLTQSVVATVAHHALDRAIPVVVVAEELRTSRREIAPLGISGAYEVRDRSRVRPTAPRPGAGELAEAVRARVARLALTWST